MTLFNKVVVTGGAGFIGSHLVDALIEKGLADRVVVIDNLSAGRREFIERWVREGVVELVVDDLRFVGRWVESVRGADIVFHLAADPEVRRGFTDPKSHFENNLLATFNLLEVCRRFGVEKHFFASSSTVYGDAKVFPTPESHPLEPISLYGAAKVGCEAMYRAYSKTLGFRVVVARYANIVGPRLRHGVVWDFVNKLLRNPSKLEILGDGTQRKSYLYISDAIEATMHLAKMLDRVEFEVFNVGNRDWITVREIADIVVEEMGLENVEYVYKPATSDGRGWPGDVKFMLLDISRIESTGWRPRYSSREAVRLTARAVLEELGYGGTRRGSEEQHGRC